MFRERSLVLPIIAMFACIASNGPAAAEKPAPVVVHLGHYTDDLHAVSMALGIATLLQEKGVPVTLFLDREGVRLADRRVTQNLHFWGDSLSISRKYASFINAGGVVLLCAHCAQAAGIGAENLLEGAQIGTDASITEAFVRASKVIDY